MGAGARGWSWVRGRSKPASLGGASALELAGGARCIESQAEETVSARPRRPAPAPRQAPSPKAGPQRLHWAPARRERERLPRAVSRDFGPPRTPRPAACPLLAPSLLPVPQHPLPFN